MKTSFFRAIALFMVVLGIELLAIDHFELRTTAAERYGFINPLETHTVTPLDWHPWGAITGGVVLFIWTFTIPKKGGGKKAEEHH